MSELLLGVDIGTSSSKGVLSRPDGEVVAAAQREHELSLPRPGWAGHDAEGVWWADFVSTCRELLGRADDRVAAVCTSGIGASLLPADERLVAVGGGTKGGLWTQIVSDVTGRPQDLPEQTIGASYGDALLAVGLAQPDTDWSTISETVEPEAQNCGIYDELYAIYRELYPATREASHALASMQKGGVDVVT